MDVIRPGGTLGQTLMAAVSVDNPTTQQWGVIVSVANGYADVQLNGGGMIRKKRVVGGAVKQGDEVIVEETNGEYTIKSQSSEASSSRGAGLVIMGTAIPGTGGAIYAYPYPHAPTHGIGGGDRIYPVDIGAATPTDITSAMNAHLANTDPHLGYLPLTGVRPMLGSLTTQDIFADAPNQRVIGSALVPFLKLHVSEIASTIFVKEAITIPAGVLMVVPVSGVLAADALATDVYMNFGQAVTPNDFIQLSDGVNTEIVQVGALILGTLYNVTRNLDGSGANAWPQGTVYADMGYNGTGRIAIIANDNKPKISILLQGTTYSATTEVVRIGNMNGAFGVATDVFGFGFGNLAAGNYIKYDTAGGFKIKAGGDVVGIDDGGITIIAGAAYDPKNEVKFKTAGGLSVLAMGAQVVGSGNSFSTWIKAGEDSVANGYGSLLALSAKGKDTSGTGTYARANFYGATDLSGAPQIALTVFDTGVGSTHVAGTTNLVIYGDRVTCDNPIHATNGLSVGTATGATGGVIKASGDVFALGKGTGLQAQVLDNHLYTPSALTNLTTAYQVPAGLSTTHTPTVNEIVEVTSFISFAQHAGTAQCNANDPLIAACSLYYSSADHNIAATGVYATGNTGSQATVIKAYALLTAGVSYTIRMLAKNDGGARGLVDYASWMDVKYRAA